MPGFRQAREQHGAVMAGGQIDGAGIPQRFPQQLAVAAGNGMVHARQNQERGAGIDIRGEAERLGLEEARSFSSASRRQMVAFRVPVKRFRRLGKLLWEMMDGRSPPANAMTLALSRLSTPARTVFLILCTDAEAAEGLGSTSGCRPS